MVTDHDERLREEHATDTTTDERPPVASEPAPKPDWWVRHYTFFGTAFGLVFIWLSLTPSLLPADHCSKAW